MQVNFYNGAPAVLVHNVPLIGNQGICRIIHCRWPCGSLVMQRPLQCIIVIVYDISMVIVYKESIVIV